MTISYWIGAGWASGLAIYLLCKPLRDWIDPLLERPNPLVWVPSKPGACVTAYLALLLYGPLMIIIDGCFEYDPITRRHFWAKAFSSARSTPVHESDSRRCCLCLPDDYFDDEPDDIAGAQQAADLMPTEAEPSGVTVFSDSAGHL